MVSKSEKTIIDFGDKVLTLEIKNFGSSEIAIEDLLQVDMNAIIEDIITFPVIFNRISNLKAEMEDLLRESQLDFSIFEAGLRQKYRKPVYKEAEDAKGNKKDKLTYPTIGEVDDAVTLDSQYKVKKQQVNLVKKQADILDGLYWSAKSKDQKLNAISAKLKPEEFEKEILETTINSVLIRSQKNNFPDRRK